MTCFSGIIFYQGASRKFFSLFLCHVDYLPFHFVADRSEGIQGIVENLNMMNIVEVKIDKQRIMVSPLASIEEDNERRK